MFIKVITGEYYGPDGSKTYRVLTETLYECARYTRERRISPKLDREDRDVIFTMEGMLDGGSISLSIVPGNNTSVYVMNGEGKTIDTYHY